MTIEETLWVEKHRPQTFGDIVGQDDVVNRLEKYVDDDEIPHMLFSGPPGVGKTAAATAFARQQFGDNWRNNFSEMNASDERGIDTIREKVKGIARQNPAGGASYKIIFLDEADQLSRDAQPALRRIMEDHSNVTRFFLSCNWINQIIDPILSRVSTFRFSALTDGDIRELLQRVSEAEELKVDPEAADKIVREARGDARKAITMLQSATVDGEVTESSTETVTGIVDDKEVSQIFDLAVQGEIMDAKKRLDERLLKEGANPNLLAESFLRVAQRKDIPAPGMMKIQDKIAEKEFRVLEGANPQVQFHSLLTDINVGYHLTFNGRYGDD